MKYSILVCLFSLFCLFGCGGGTAPGGVSAPQTQPSAPVAQDWGAAVVMRSGAYSDVPYLVRLSDGAIVSTMTASEIHEGDDSQYVGVIRSTDNGATWSDILPLEPSSGPEASWAVPFYDEDRGRLYVFYTYNHENIRFVPDNDGVGGSGRMDTIGKIAYRHSDDGGLTWSDRELINMEVKAIDQRNPFSGTKQLFWLFGQPQYFNGKLYLGLSKIGRVNNGNMFIDTEAFLLRIDVGDTLSGFTLLPSSHNGLRSHPFWTSATNDINEEPSFLIDARGINVVYRTGVGRLAEAWSVDGLNFTNDWARTEGGAETILHPRGPANIFRLPDGRYFLWTYNNEATGFLSRNPVYYRIGRRVGPRIEWGQANLLMSDATPQTRISYASMLADGNELLISAADKKTAKILRYRISDL